MLLAVTTFLLFNVLFCSVCSYDIQSYQYNYKQEYIKRVHFLPRLISLAAGKCKSPAKLQLFLYIICYSRKRVSSFYSTFFFKLNIHKRCAAPYTMTYCKYASIKYNTFLRNLEATPLPVLLSR